MAVYVSNLNSKQRFGDNMLWYASLYGDGGAFASPGKAVSIEYLGRITRYIAVPILGIEWLTC